MTYQQIEEEREKVIDGLVKRAHEHMVKAVVIYQVSMTCFGAIGVIFSITFSRVKENTPIQPAPTEVRLAVIKTVNDFQR